MILKGTNIEDKFLAEWVKEKLLPRIAIDIRIHGSRVHGTPRADSDVDVFVIVKECNIPEEGTFENLEYEGLKIEMRVFDDDYVPSWIKWFPNLISIEN
jgi:predicted nucleotidyltransferase